MISTNRDSDPTRLRTAAGAFRAGAQNYARMGSPLYSALCAAGAEDADILALAAHAMAGSQPAFHLLASVHYLLLDDPSDPLARYFATLAEDVAPPAEAYPEFARFCRRRRDEILALLAERTVQTTYVERCTGLLAPLCVVADAIGEPLDLLEIGCSAGVLLTYDKYGYDMKGQGRIGPDDASFRLDGEVRGGPRLRIPRIGSRTGVDIHPVDAKSAEERRWLVAQTFPEFREQRARLTAALDIVANTDIRMIAGNALDVLPDLLAEQDTPLCIFHSACLYYWNAEAKSALDDILKAASRNREIYRVGLEASERFNERHKGRAETVTEQGSGGSPSGEITITHYVDGRMDGRIVAQTEFAGPIVWIG